MQIALYPRPGKERLLRDLQAKLGQEWRVRFFGFGKFKTIIASRSPLHAIQISYSGKHESKVEGTYASAWSALMAVLDGYFGTGTSSYNSQRSDWKEMEADIVSFLKKRYPAARMDIIG